MRPSYAFIALFAVLTVSKIADDSDLVACAVSSRCVAFAATVEDLDALAEEIAVDRIVREDMLGLEQTGRLVLGPARKHAIRTQTRLEVAQYSAYIDLAAVTLKAAMTALIATAALKLAWRMVVLRILARALDAGLKLAAWVFLD